MMALLMALSMALSMAQAWLRDPADELWTVVRREPYHSAAEKTREALRHTMIGRGELDLVRVIADRAGRSPTADEAEYVTGRTPDGFAVVARDDGIWLGTPDGSCTREAHGHRGTGLASGRLVTRGVGDRLPGPAHGSVDDLVDDIVLGGGA
jgi:hypothetical protein